MVISLLPTSTLTESAAIAQMVSCTEAEGPGKRFALWFQGCPLRCPGCCNPEFLPFEGGEQRKITDLISGIEAARESGIEGISLLGGEPFAHAVHATMVAKAARKLGLSVMVYSGYTLEEIRTLGDDAANLLAEIDILVDGPYRREMPDHERRWIGSLNQQVHFLTDRYRADDPCWRMSNTLEVRLELGTITVNGFPAVGAEGLWKPRWTRKIK